MPRRADDGTSTVRGIDASRSRRLSIVVLGETSSSTFPLPDAGEVVIGRGRGVDLPIEDASISRRHAVLRVGPAVAPEITIEDLGSANGTRVRGTPAPPGTRVAVDIGDVIDVGAVMLIVQRRPGEPAHARDLEPAPHAAPIAPRDGEMVQLDRLVERIARGQINVLVLGETGAGKEVLAERIHRLSPRRAAPFLRLNCAALSETLLETELFGHERGAFTGAVAAKSGLLETAEGGTVFLDEVGELPMSIQVKLLRVIETRSVLRVGGLKARAIDVRFIAATNRDLDAEVARGTFRADLFFRLDGVALVVPPLRRRVAEIPDLARAFAVEAAAKLEAPEPEIASDAMALLQAYSWPGNIRELRNVMERAVLLSRDGRIGRDQLPVDKMRAAIAIVPPPAPPPAAPASAPAPGGRGHEPRAARARGLQSDELDALRRRIDDLERERILEALERCGGNQTRAARLLGMPRRTLVSRLSKYDVPRPRK